MYYIAGEQISGKALCQLDRETLKELGIQSIGKQLELLRNVKSLFGKKVTLIKIYKKSTCCVCMKLLVQNFLTFTTAVEPFKGNTEIENAVTSLFKGRT